MSTTTEKALCKHCGEAIEPTGGKLYPWTHVDPNQQKCGTATPVIEKGTFTPGPWRIYHKSAFDTRIVTESDNGTCVASMPNWAVEHGRELDANANLIAAAPEMYEALEVALAFLSSAAYDYLSPIEARDKVQAALKKARGGK